jgi:hypothetical protein
MRDRRTPLWDFGSVMSPFPLALGYCAGSLDLVAPVPAAPGSLFAFQRPDPDVRSPTLSSRQFDHSSTVIRLAGEPAWAPREETIRPRPEAVGVRWTTADDHETRLAERRKISR